jgi:hypothetical protein
MEDGEMMEGFEKCFAFAFAMLCLMMVCTIPYDRLASPNRRTEPPNRTTISATKRTENKDIAL